MYIEEVFNMGLKQRPAVASDVEMQMQEVTNEDGNPRFDRNSYLDEDQIKVNSSDYFSVVVIWKQILK